MNGRELILEDVPIEIAGFSMLEPPDREPYNLDALWARIAVELDDAKLVQLERHLRIGGQRVSLRELADQLGHAGRFIIERIAKP